MHTGKKSTSVYVSGYRLFLHFLLFVVVFEFQKFLSSGADNPAS